MGKVRADCSFLLPVATHDYTRRVKQYLSKWMMSTNRHERDENQKGNVKPPPKKHWVSQKNTGNATSKVPSFASIKFSNPPWSVCVPRVACSKPKRLWHDPIRLFCLWCLYNRGFHVIMDWSRGIWTYLLWNLIPWYPIAHWTCDSHHGWFHNFYHFLANEGG